jgi:hypothetical protein
MKLEEITEVLLEYVKKDVTDYAILLNGQWGSGKTYFVKNILRPEIENVLVKGNDNKFKCRYLSVFGIKTVEDFNQELFLALNPKFNSAFFKIGGQAVTDVISSKLGLNKSTIKGLIGNRNIPNDIALIIDDLERCEKTSLHNILGSLNNLIEHENVKIILLADETKIKGKFSSFKEKVIRYSLQFKQDIPKFIEQYAKNDIVNERYSKFINKHIYLISNCLDKGQHENLRTCKFIIDSFEKIHSLILVLKLDKEMQKNILERILFFYSIYAIELKKGNLQDDIEIKKITTFSVTLWHELDLSSKPFDGFFNTDKNLDKADAINEREDMHNRFKNSYFKNSNNIPFVYNKELANYAKNGFFENEKLTNYILELNKIIKDKQLSEGQKLNDSIRFFLVIEQTELNESINQLFEKLGTTSFTLSEYCELTFILKQIEYKKITTEIPVNYIDIIMEEINLKYKNSSYNQRLKNNISFFRISSEGKEFDEPEYQKVMELVLEKNEELLMIEKKDLIEKMKNDFKEDNLKAFFDIITDGKNLSISILSEFENEEFLDQFSKLSNYNKNELLFNLNYRYKNCSHKNLANEIQFLTSLKKTLKELSGLNPNSILGFYYEKLCDHITWFEEIFEKQKEWD